MLSAHTAREDLVFNVVEHFADSRHGFVEFSHLRLEQMDDELGWTVEVAAVVDFRAQLIGGAGGLPARADQAAPIQIKPQGGDLFRIEVETEVVTDIADDPHQAVADSFESFAVVGVQQESARRLR